MASTILRRNVSANYASQLYSIIVGVVMVPMYLKYMGTETYGLIGLFAILQLCVQSLDMGITPTLSREVARSRAGATQSSALWQLLRSFEVIFVGLGLLILVGVAASANYISTGWIKAGHLDVVGVERSLVLMAASAWLRWFSGLYRGVVAGFEKQVWQSGMNAAIATAHSIVVIPFLAYVGATPVYFFTYQFAVSAIEFLLVSRKAYQLLPDVSDGSRIWFQFGAMQRVFRFSAIIAVTGGLWVIVTQTDKILLSKILSLSDFGLFSLATVVAGGIATLNLPLSNALLPRLTDLSARAEQVQLVSLYRNATQFVAVMACSAALFLALFSRPVLWVWTGNVHFADGAAVTLTLYALGNGVSALGAFPYYLQYAKGKLSLHLVGSILYLFVLVPSVVLLALKYGTVGAGSAWLGTNLLFLMCWVPYVHRRFLGPFHLSWLTRDVGIICVATATAEVTIKSLVVWPSDRFGAGILLFAFATLSVAAAAAASSFARGALAAAWVRFRAGRVAPSV